MNDETLHKARAGDEQAFDRLTDPYRRELRVHCYQILGSLQDAEDALQETLVSAWKALDSYEGRGTFRAWLYRIATNHSLSMLRSRSPQATTPLMSELPEPTGQLEAPWLEPYPDALLESVADRAPGPDARYDAKETITLAFIAALQLLPPSQRATLLLRDVLGFRASEVAEMLGTTEGAVTGALQRARETLSARMPQGRRERSPLPDSAVERRIAAQFVDAFQDGDIESVVALLTNDATFTMPPEPLLYQGHDAIAKLLANRFSWRGAHHLQLLETRANSQPAFGCYLRDPHAPIAHAHGMIVLTLEGDRIAAITRFLDNSILHHFGLPRTVRERGNPVGVRPLGR